MSRFLVDENLPRSLVHEIEAAGHEATHVADVGLRGKPDGDVFAFATEKGLAIVTGDLDFANTHTYPLGTHAGIVVIRLPEEMSIMKRKRLTLAALMVVPHDELAGNLLIVDPGGIRLRRASIG